MTDFTSVLVDMAERTMEKDGKWYYMLPVDDLLKVVEQLCSEVLGEDDATIMVERVDTITLGRREYEYRSKLNEKRNELRAEQRKTLAAALRGEKV